MTAPTPKRGGTIETWSAWAATLWVVAAMALGCGGAAYDAAEPGYAAEGAPPAEPPSAALEPARAAMPSPAPQGPAPEALSPAPPGAVPVAGVAAGGVESAATPPTKPADGAGPVIAKERAPAGATRAKEDGSVESKARPTIAQMLVYTAQLRLRVVQKAFAESIDQVVEIAVEMGGYIVKHDDQTVQVRVPSARFRDALKAMEKLGEVVHRAVQAQDVTEEYHDLSVRLKSLRATRDRLEQFLERAKNIQEVLAVEKELNRLNAEIDRIEGRMRFLASRAAFSTITVALEPKPEKVVVVDSGDEVPPPPRTLALPIDWLSRVGLDRLLDLN